MMIALRAAQLEKIPFLIFFFLHASAHTWQLTIPIPQGCSVLVQPYPPPPHTTGGACWSTVYRCANKGLQNYPKQCVRHCEIDTPFHCFQSKSNPFQCCQLKRILSNTSANFLYWGPPQGFWGSGEKGFLFSGSWGALLIILGELGSKHILLGI